MSNVKWNENVMVPHCGPTDKKSYSDCIGPKSARRIHTMLWRCYAAILTCVSKTATAPHPRPRRETTWNAQRLECTGWFSCTW